MQQNSIFSTIDFGPFKNLLEDNDITDISYSNGGQVWIRTLSKGNIRGTDVAASNAVVEKIAFQCSNVMGTTFNMASPFLDAESEELRLNFVHDSISKNGIAMVMRKTPAKIRLVESRILEEKYITQDIHDFLILAVLGHCNVIVSGETGSGKTEFVKYLAAHTRENEKLITIEDTLELHLDRIFPNRDIVSMKTNNIASYTDVLVTCMRQNPKWILLSEVRSAEAVMAVRNSISSGHNILSTIHSDKAESIPLRMYSLLESNIDIDQFLKSVHRYVQIGVHIRAYFSKELNRFHREVAEVVEFYVDNDNFPKSNTIYRKGMDGAVVKNSPSEYLVGYLSSQGVIVDGRVAIDIKKEVSVPTDPDAFKKFADEVSKEPEISKVQPDSVPQVNAQQVDPSVTPVSLAAGAPQVEPVGQALNVVNPDVTPSPVAVQQAMPNFNVPPANPGNLNQ